MVDRYLKVKFRHKNLSEIALTAEGDKSHGVLLASGYIAGGALAADPHDNPTTELSLKAGGHFPQITSKLGSSFDGTLKVGYAPWAAGAMQVFAELGYSQPQYTLQGTDGALVIDDDYDA